MNHARLFSIISIIILAAIYRILPHPPNVTPLIAVALFSGAKVNDKWQAIFLPLVIMLISDFFLGLHNTLFFVYAAIVLTVFIGFFLIKKTSSIVSAVHVFFATILATALFFIITNFGVWWISDFYAPTWQGLLECYVAGLPFLQKSLAGNLLFSFIIFSGFHLAELKIPLLRTNNV